MRAFIQGVLLAAALLPLGTRPSSAQGADVLRQLIPYCMSDAALYCADVEPGGGRVAACLYSRLDDLSPRCRRAMRDGIALRSCGHDYERYCADVMPGEGRIPRCLRAYRDELSPRCAAALAFSVPRRRDYGWRDHPPKYAAPHRSEPVEPDLDDDTDNGRDDLK
jgi:hypothetical protein